MAYLVGMPSVISGLVLLAFWLFCLFHVITTPWHEVRNLPKAAWVIIVALLPGLGGLLWLLFGRPQAPAWHDPAAGAGWREQPQPGRPIGPDDDPEFLRSLDRRLRGEE
ncbi:membrane protein [Thermobispora bispora]|jgi:hypothetical protein|uniref:Cardiolipin synthase N-terminal domain-containing protein n=2 Tax=Thermobispora bispora TaxID=2006 RepID=D6Y3H5_THEBD|nr:hypothetical protein Tbis_0273 [Thermobispora bispora DSM 43833]